MPTPLHIALAVAAAIALSPLHRSGQPATTPGAATAGGRSVLAANDNVDDRVVGVVRGQRITSSFGYGALIDTGAANVWVWSQTALDPGERVAVTGRLRTSREMRNPGTPPRLDREFELTATALERLGLEDDVRSRAWRWAIATQTAWAARVDDAVGDRRDPGGAALRGIVTGVRGDVPDGLNERWRACGIFHALSVSGLHLAVVAGIAFWLLRKLAAASPWGGRIRPACWAAVPALTLAVAYTLVTGAQVATLRSLLVVVIVILACVLDRPIRLVDALAVAAIAVLITHPDDLYDPSFQLSFAAAFALAAAPAQPRAGNRLWHWFARSVASSLRVAIATAPITAYHFHQVAVGGVVGNLVLTPILELVALPLGLLGVAAGAAWPSFGTATIRVAAWTSGVVDALAQVLARIVPVGTITVASSVVMAVLVALSLWAVCTQRRTVAALLWVALCLAWTRAAPPAPPGTLRVTFLDVGQGDAALIELPDGGTWLIDAGGLASRRDLASASAPGRAIQRVLEAKDRTALDLVVISHPHPDHYVGLAGLTAPVRELWTADEMSEMSTDEPQRATPAPSALPSFDSVAKMTRAVIHHPPLGLARSRAGVDLVVWGPRYSPSEGAPEREATDPVRSVNDNSLVVELRYAGRSIAFTGDVESEGEANLVTAGLGHVDVVKVAHHGSPTSSSPAFVAATRPGTAVISCGVGNSFGFPSAAVVERWQSVGASVERTDVHGAIAITIAANGELAVDRFAARSP